MIEPDIDAYGGLAHGSALADYLELLALGGDGCTRSQLKDNMQDKYLTDWKRKKRNMVVDLDDWQDDGTYDDNDEHDIAGHIDEAFDCLYERIDLLGERYPFELDDYDESLRVRDGFDIQKSSYVSLLCLTSAHAYGVKVGAVASVRDLFEEIVASTVEGRGLLVARLGDLSRKNGMKFVPALIEAGDALQVKVNPQSAPFRRHANDAGADVLAHFSWGDNRMGRWTLAGQVTCAKSDYWQGKMGQAQAGLWRDFFSEKVDPLCFLAVPHHAPRGTYNLVVTEHGKVLLDRLRLVMLRDQITPDEASVIAAVVAEGVDKVSAA